MKRNTLVALVIFIIVVVNIIIFISIYQKSLAPSDSGAATNVKTVLTLASPTSVANIPVGTNITVALALQNTTGISVGEIVLAYDPAVLTGVSMTEATNVLGLNKTINNTTGRITIDIANSGPGIFPENTKLVDFVFSLKSGSTASTVISTASQTTLGSPNQLASTGLGTLTLKFIPTRCGDGTTQTPNDAGFNEQCDAGTNNGVVCTAAYGGSCQYCTTSCTWQTVTGPRCGDGTKQTQEQCDAGTNNGVVCNAAYGGTCTYCNNSCQNVTVTGPKCGDAIVQSGNGEQCDNGVSNGTACTPTYGNNCTYCNNSCQTTTVTGPKCGDGIKQTQEQCDDSNTLDYDACAANCQVTCNGTTQVAKGAKCIDIACRGDYGGEGTVDLNDFAAFAQNYKKTGIACNRDILIQNGVCYLDIADFGEFASVYKVDNVCL